VQVPNKAKKAKNHVATAGDSPQHYSKKLGMHNIRMTRRKREKISSPNINNANDSTTENDATDFDDNKRSAIFAENGMRSRNSNQVRHSQNTAIINSADLQQPLQTSENMTLPGAFAIPGTGGEDVAWDSHYGGLVSDDKSVEEEPEIVVKVISNRMLNKTIEDEIIMETTQAEILLEDSESEAKKKRIIVCWAIVLFTTLGTVIGLSIGLTKTKSSTTGSPTMAPTIAPTHNLLPTLDIIQTNGVVRCGYVYDSESALCRALAAAVLGDPNKMIKVPMSLTEKWEALEVDRSVDVLTIGTALSMELNVYQVSHYSMF